MCALEAFFAQHSYLRNVLIYAHKYFFKYVSYLLFVVFLLFRCIWTVLHIFVICVFNMFLWLWNSIKYMKFRKLKTRMYKITSNELRKFKLTYYWLEKSMGSEIANEVLDFIQPVPNHFMNYVGENYTE